MVVISNWAGEYTFLRNDFPADVTTKGGTTYPSVEHAFQALKADYSGLEPLEAEKIKAQIRDAQSAREAKRIGNQLDLDAGWWEEHRKPIMKDLLHRKFTQNEGLGQALLRTNGHKIVMKYHDSFWGDGGDGSGENHLGKMLMELRDKLGTKIDTWINPDGTIKWDGTRKPKPAPFVGSPILLPPSSKAEPVPVSDPAVAAFAEAIGAVATDDASSTAKPSVPAKVFTSNASAVADSDVKTSQGYKDALGKICGDIDDI